MQQITKNPRNWLIERHFLPSFQASGTPTYFAHYTNKVALLSILQNQEIWLKKTSEMNDISEVKHGVELIKGYFFSKADKFWKTIDNTHYALASQIKSDFQEWLEDLYSETYITCLTEFSNSEPSGRLSMWRGYGNNEAVAMVISNKFLDYTNNPYGIIATPAFYYSNQQVEAFFQSFDAIAQQYQQLLRQNSREVVKSAILSMLKTMAFAFKHPGFSEEREWRIVYRPNEKNLKNLTRPDAKFCKAQTNYYTLPLGTKSSGDLQQLSFESLIYQVIVGPSRIESQTYQQLELFLKKMSYNSENLLRYSGIPYRG